MNYSIYVELQKRANCAAQRESRSVVAGRGRREEWITNEHRGTFGVD